MKARIVLGKGGEKSLFIDPVLESRLGSEQEKEKKNSKITDGIGGK